MGALFVRAVLGILLLITLNCPAQAGQFEDDLLARINMYRAANYLKPLTMRPTYVDLAREESLAMRKIDRLSHDGFNTSFRKAGISGLNGCVENVAWNYATAQSLFNDWQQSPEHNRNMLDRDITEAGIAKVGPYITFFACY